VAWKAGVAPVANNITTVEAVKQLQYPETTDTGFQGMLIPGRCSSETGSLRVSPVANFGILSRRHSALGDSTGCILNGGCD
jgi:hypothetical protein